MSIQQGSAGGMPVLILKEGASQTKGRDAQKNNIAAAKLIAQMVKTSLGPRGMDKMLVDTLGDVTITNDGATILKEIDVQHPAAKIMVEISKATDNEVGDGTTSTVVLAGSLLSKAEELIAKGVHPSVIVDGYSMASEKALEILRNASTKADPADRQILGKIARTSMASKLVSVNSEPLSKIVVDAVIAVAEKARDNNNLKVDVDSIKVEKKAGVSIEDTKLIQGIVLDKEVVHGAMPKRIEDAKIALLNAALEIEKTEMSAEIRISEPQQMHMFLEEENRMLKSMVDKVSASGANVLLCQKGIDDLAQHYLAKEGILAVRRVKESDMNNLAKATGGRVLSNIDELSADDLGYAKLVEERKVETDKWVFVEGCKNPKALSILIRGGSQRVVDEAERSVHDAIMVVKDVLEYPYVIAGGGAPEALVAARLRDWSGSLSGRTQIAAYRFAEAIEAIPITLAENAGMDPLDTQVQLRARVAESLERSGQGRAEIVKAKYGINVIEGKVADVSKQNIFEPLAVKEQVINSATEAASLILRIDDVIAASKPKSEGHAGHGGMGAGGGEMGDFGE